MRTEEYGRDHRPPAKKRTSPHGENMRRLQLVFDSAPMGIVHLDEERRYLTANPAFQKFVGYSLEELRSKTLFDLTHPDDLAASRAASERFADPSYSLRRLEKRYITKSGEVVWGLVTSRQVKDPSTGRKNLLTVIEDITELKKRESELKQAESEIAHFFSVSLDLMCVAGFDGTLRSVNNAFTETLGYRASELQSRPFIELVHPDDVAATEMELNRLMQGIPTLRFENRYRTKPGDYRLLSWIAAPDMRSQLIYATARDVTEKKSSEIKLAYSSKMASLGEMAGGMAHEVNNPLAIILGKVTNLKTMLDRPRPDLELVKEELQSIERTGQRIAKIVRGLRAFSRQSDADPMVRVPVSRLIDDTLELCAERLKSRAIELMVECPRDAFVRGRPGQLSQVLMNLVSNSYDAVESAQDPWIRIDVAEKGGQVTIAVEDCGTGIPAPILGKIMQPFFTTKEVGKGTGLGLSISKGIVEEHGGQLRYDDSSPHTRFVIELPACGNSSLSGR